MTEVKGNLWGHPADIRIITTNGTINSKGECVMGRGCAREAKELFPALPKLLAKRIKAEGNHPYYFEELGIISFPVKHNWYEKADPILIRTSALQLHRMLDLNLSYVMPRPGCDLDWKHVKRIISFLPDNVTVISFPNEE